MKSNKGKGAADIFYNDELRSAKAEERREQLLVGLDAADFDAQYTQATPTRENRFSFRPSDVATHYLEWAKLTDLCADAPSNGLMEKRGGALIDIDRDALEGRMKMYFDKSVSWKELKGLDTGLTEDAARFDAEKARSKVIAAKSYERSRLIRYALRPFDTRWCYYSEIRPLWNEPRPTLWAQCWEGNSFILTRWNRAKDPEGSPVLFTPCLSDDHIIAPDAVAIPLRLRTSSSAKKKNHQQDSFFADAQTTARSILLVLALISLHLALVILMLILKRLPDHLVSRARHRIRASVSERERRRHTLGLPARPSACVA